MLRALEPWHLLVLAVIVVVLFGGKRLPGAARSLGQSLRILKSEVNQLKEENPKAATPPIPLEGTVMAA